jgi:coproporphyrinogen III oxidase
MQEITTFLKELREEIISAFEKIENGKTFERKPWTHHTGGGGEIGLLRGTIFEKAAVNFSCVHGDSFPMQDGSGPFVATGISLITHMANPHAPTVHMNLRFIKTSEKQWFGGGYDLTPMGFPYNEDTAHFHAIAHKTLGPLYESFAQHAATYFYLPHRKKERGVGGIFFDHYNTGDFETDLKLWKTIGKTFLDAILPIYTKRINMPFSEEEKALQLKMRAHYAEFNLLYDRGTQFGFKSGGNPEAILCSMPPLASW